jgi:hypothetical protein
MIHGRVLYKMLYPRISWQASGTTGGRPPWSWNQPQDGCTYDLSLLVPPYIEQAPRLVLTPTDEISVRKGTSRDTLPEPFEVKAPEEEKQQLLRLLYRMKNSNGKESKAKEFLKDPLFDDPENRFQTIVLR